MGVKSSTKPDAWTLSPQLTAAPEMWRGCIACWPMWDGSGEQVMDVVSRRDGTFQNASALGWSLGSEGKNLSFQSENASGHLTIIDGVNLTPKKELTYWFYAKPSTKNSSKTVYGKEIGGPWNKIGTLFADELRGTLTAGGTIEDIDVSIQPGELLTGALTYDGVNARVYVNGAEGGVAAMSGDVDYTSEAPAIGRSSADSTGAVFDGEIYIVALWDRALTDNELKLLNDDPYIMLRPAGF